MALNASKIKGQTKFERPPALEPGTYPARLVQILSLGLQKQRPYKGEPKDPKPELYLTYELLDEFLIDKETGEEILDKPRWISETIPMNSLDSDLAKSTKRYFSLDPSGEFGGDWSKLANTPCMVTVVNNSGKGKNEGVVFENISGVSSMRPKEAAKAPELKNPPKVFDIDEPDMTIFNSLPTWLQDKMKENLEFGGSVLEKSIGSSSKDDDPDEEEGSDSSEQSDEDDGDEW